MLSDIHRIASDGRRVFIPRDLLHSLASRSERMDNNLVIMSMSTHERACRPLLFVKVVTETAVLLEIKVFRDRPGVELPRNRERLCHSAHTGWEVAEIPF